MVEVKVLGTGCAKCSELHEAVVEAVRSAGLSAEVSKVEDVGEILAHGVMMTPALVVDGAVRSTGTVPSQEQIVSWLRAADA
jgi:small redox-active disulfide protein 2